MQVVHIITGLDDGGAEAVLFRLCTHDTPNKHIVLSMMNEGKYGPLLKNAGIKVYCLDMPQGRLTLPGLYFLFKLLRKYSPDVVQTWMYHADLIGGIVARLAGVRKVVWGVHHTTLEKGESKRSTIFIARLNALLSKIVPHRIIYCAEKSRQVQESIGFKSDIGEVVFNGYDIDDFIVDSNRGEVFRREIESGGSFVIGNVGRYHPFKDYPTLVSAVALLAERSDNFKVVLVGSELTENNKKLNQLILDANCKRHVNLLGRRNDIPVVMNGFDLFVLSSSSEAFPNVLNEAMACGIPCVATDVGDAGVIVGDTGWVVPPKDPVALANAILAAIEEQKNNPQAWKDRKKSCRQRIVKNFSVCKMTAGYNRVWASR